MGGNLTLIVGASRGIGAELVRQYLAAGQTVHATVRNARSVEVLETLDGDLTVHQLDVRDVAAGEQLASELAGAGLAVAILNAGIFRGHPRADVLEVNTEAPLRMAEELIRAQAFRQDGVLVLMSSQLGSRRGRTGSLGDYGDSKAALNDGLRQRAEGWRTQGVIAVVVHPGWVRTDMGGTGATLSVEESVSGIRNLVDGLRPDDYGRFWSWDGRELPW